MGIRLFHSTIMKVVAKVLQRREVELIDDCQIILPSKKDL